MAVVTLLQRPSLYDELIFIVGLIIAAVGLIVAVVGIYLAGRVEVHKRRRYAMERDNTIKVHLPDGHDVEMTPDEYRVFKRGKMDGKLVQTPRCSNCGAAAVGSDGICFQCGSSFPVG